MDGIYFSNNNHSELVHRRTLYFNENEASTLRCVSVGGYPPPDVQVNTVCLSVSPSISPFLSIYPIPFSPSVSLCSPSFSLICFSFNLYLVGSLSDGYFFLSIPLCFFLPLSLPVSLSLCSYVFFFLPPSFSLSFSFFLSPSVSFCFCLSLFHFLCVPIFLFSPAPHSLSLSLSLPSLYL